MKLKLFLLAFSVVFSVSSAFAQWDKRPEFRWKQYFRYDSRIEIKSLYVNRYSLSFNYLDSKQQQLLKITPFFEMRRNFHTDLWEREELGLEIGKDIFPWLYIGQSIEKVWRNEDWHAPRFYERDRTTETRTRAVYTKSLIKNKSFTLKGSIADEFYFDADDGRLARNEVAIGVGMPLRKYLELGLNWRHIDRIDYYDSDTFESSVTLIF